MHQRPCSCSPTYRSVPGPRKRSASKRRSVQQRCPLAELGLTRLPGAHRVGLVEPGHELDVPPQPVEVGLAVDGLGPARGRRRHEPPVDLLLALGPAHRRDLRHEVQPRPLRRHPAEQVRGRAPAQRDQRSVLGGQGVGPGVEPLRRRGERISRRVLEPGQLVAAVVVPDVDEAGARGVGLARDRPRERVLLDRRVHGHELARWTFAATRTASAAKRASRSGVSAGCGSVTRLAWWLAAPRCSR